MVAGPTVPPPPALLSMTMGWPMNFDALSAIARIEKSVDPPAGHGTISVIGLVGYSCASAEPAKIAAAAIAMTKPLPCSIEFLFGCGPRFESRRRMFLVCGRRRGIKGGGRAGCRAINDNYDSVARRRLRHYVRAFGQGKHPPQKMPSRMSELVSA